MYNHAQPVTFSCVFDEICQKTFFGEEWAFWERVFVYVYLMKYAGKHFLEKSGRSGNVVLKMLIPVHKTPTALSPLPHEGTTRTP